MKKYKDYLENKFEKWQVVITVLCALAMLIAIFVEMSIPVDSKEIEGHYTRLETIRQDITNICEIENGSINIDSNGMTITLKGKYHNMMAYFDENKNYTNAIIEDNRLGSNIFLSIICVLFSGSIGFMLSYVILILLYIPVLVNALVLHIKRKHALRKTNKK